MDSKRERREREREREREMVCVWRVLRDHWPFGVCGQLGDGCPELAIVLFEQNIHVFKQHQHPGLPLSV